MAVDQQALIQARNGLARPSCTDHGSALHPGYDPNAPCPVFDLTAANKLLDDNGWVKGADGVRARGGQRLEFEYSTSVGEPWRVAGEVVLQSDFRKIGIKLDIQNYPPGEFFTEKFWQGPTSPPSGAVAGRFDIAEFGQNILNYDPDDATLLACDQALTGYNFGSYCNPALDALYKQEQETVDAGVRQQIFIQIHQIYLTEFPFIVLHSPLDLAMVRRRTHNYQPGPFITAETINIWEWWCDNGKC